MLREKARLALFVLGAFMNVSTVSAQAATTTSTTATVTTATAAANAAKARYQSIVSVMQKRPLRPVGIANDLSSWNAVSVKFPIWHKIQGYIETQPRFQMNHENHFAETILRTGIGYELNKNWSIFNGYYWSAHNDPYYSPENRIWHQLTYTRKLGTITLQDRFRCEESWREAFVGPTVRIRNQIKLTRPIAHSSFYAIVSNEPMYNLNTKTTGPVAGFTQNRFFVGVGKKLNSFTKLEIGYLNQYRNSRSAKPDPMNHVLAASLSFDFTGHKQDKNQQFKLAQKPISSVMLSCTPRLFLPGNDAPVEILATEHHRYELVRTDNQAKSRLAEKPRLVI